MLYNNWIAYATKSIIDWLFELDVNQNGILFNVKYACIWRFDWDIAENDFNRCMAVIDLKLVYNFIQLFRWEVIARLTIYGTNLSFLIEVYQLLWIDVNNIYTFFIFIIGLFIRGCCEVDDIMVSVCVTTYNHEKYVAQALDSIIAQKTKYSMEVLVGDDCSTDNTQAILRQYEKQYPGFFKMFYRKRNMYHSIPTNSMDLRSRACGKYVIILEGDDYWTDNHKLEEQIDFLEGHQEYLAVAHNCVAVNETSQPNGENYPECKENEYTLNHFLHGVVPGQLTIMVS